MTTMTKNIDLISRYFDGEMEDWEKIEFREKLKSDPNLQQDYKLYLMVENDLKAMQDEIEILSQSDYATAEKIARETLDELDPDSEKIHSIKSFISDSGNNLSRNKQRKRRSQKNLRITIYTLAIAASLVTGLILVNTLILPPDPDKLFTEYYTSPHVVTDYTRNPSNTEKDLLNEAIILMSEGSYEQAGLLLNEMLNADKISAQILFLSSIAKIENEQYPEALNLLRDPRIKNSEYELEALWYQSLLELKVEGPERAESLFLRLSRMPGKYQDEALAILSGLRKIK